MEVWGGNVRTERRFRTPGLDIWITSQPEGHSRAGGDVYYTSSCASGRITRLLLADVSGHGQLVAGVAERLRDLMRDNVNTIGHRPFVSAMNRNFTDETEGCRFATAIVSSYFAPTRSLSICNAGHPPPLIFRAADQQWSVLDSSEAGQRKSGEDVTNLPLGITPETSYSEHSLRLCKGDMILCYTDAFTEVKSPNGGMLGVGGLLEIVSSASTTSPEAILACATATLRTYDQSDEHEDDATLMLFRANGQRSTLRDNVAAPFRLLGRAADQSRILPVPVSNEAGSSEGAVQAT